MPDQPEHDMPSQNNRRVVQVLAEVKTISLGSPKYYHPGMAAAQSCCSQGQPDHAAGEGPDGGGQRRAGWQEEEVGHAGGGEGEVGQAG